MAEFIDALSILTKDDNKAKLKLAYGGVLENIKTELISSRLKNKTGSGTPNSGTVKYHRLVNVKSAAYGTARTAGKAKNIKLEPVIVALTERKELLTEIEKHDSRLFDVPNLIGLQTAEDKQAMAIELEEAFFQEAVNSGTDASLTETKIDEWFDALVSKVATVKNDYVKGVPKSKIKVILDDATYGVLRRHNDFVDNPSVKVADGEVGRFHGIEVFSSIYIPAGTNGIAMYEGSIAQPVLPTLYEPKLVDLSNSVAFGIFFDYGTKAIMPDLIFKSTYTKE